MRSHDRFQKADTAATAAASDKAGQKSGARGRQGNEAWRKVFRLLGEARFSFNGGDFSQALGLCGQARACTPPDLAVSVRAELFEIEHSSLAAMDKLKKELSDFLSAVERHPTSGEAHFGVACRLDALGRRLEALKEYGNVLAYFHSICPACQRDCLNNIGWIHFRNGDFREAISWFDLALAVKDPSSPVPSTDILVNKAMAEASLRRQTQQATMPRRVATTSAPAAGEPGR